MAARALEARPRWDSYGRSESKEMPFPVTPRVAPAPVGSGVSFRELPEARLLEVVKCCQHYESKCAGRYPASSPAARFLFDLSREVQDLMRVLVAREQEREARIRELETLTEEWCEVFATPSPALREAGVTTMRNSPKQVAERLLETTAALERANRTLADIEHRHERDLVTFRAAIKDQTLAAREAVRVERERWDAEHAREVERARRAADSTALRAESVIREAEEAVLEATRHAEARASEVLERERARHRDALAEAEVAVRAAKAEGAAREAAIEAAMERRVRTAEAAAEGAERRAAAATESARRAEAAATATVEAEREDRRRALAGLEQSFRSRTEWRRVAALEERERFLTRRVEDLEALVHSLQSALSGRVAVVRS